MYRSAKSAIPCIFPRGPEEVVSRGCVFILIVSGSVILVIYRHCNTQLTSEVMDLSSRTKLELHAHVDPFDEWHRYLTLSGFEEIPSKP